jgi:hypothetical protein
VVPTVAEELAQRITDELCTNPDDDCCLLVNRRLPQR